jgi:hypothetical protein
MTLAAPFGRRLPRSPRAGPDSPRLDAGERAAALSRSQALLRRALARVAGQLVTRRAWERLGFARLSDWARERAGLSARQVQDLVYVDAALVRLPLVEAAFTGGEISWAKARLLCRVAEPGDLEPWLAYAHRVPVHVLEHQVRAVDRGALEAGALATDEDGADAWPRATVLVYCTPEVQCKWWTARRLAQRVAGEKLPPSECMEAVVAEVLSALPVPSNLSDPLEDDGEPSGAADVCAAHTLVAGDPPAPDEEAANVCASQASGDEVPASRAHGAAGNAALPGFLRPLVDGLEEADAFELDARFRRAVALEQRVWSEVGAWIAEVAAGGRHRLAGHRTLEAYARERLGISPRKARALLRLERAGELCPSLRSAYRDGRLSWVQAQTLLPLVTMEDSVPCRDAWIEHATCVTVRRLEDDVDRALALHDLAPPSPDRPETGRQTCAQPMDFGECDGAPDPRETARFFFTAPREVARFIDATIATVRRHVERCTDIVFRSAGGSDELCNRTTLCAWHHHRGIHAGIVRCTGDAPAGLRFDLGVRRDGPPLASFRSGDVRVVA